MFRVKSRKHPVSRSCISLGKAEKETAQMMPWVYVRPCPYLTWDKTSSLAPVPRRACPCLGISGARKQVSDACNTSKKTLHATLDDMHMKMGQ